jgi:hypothetical protein
LARRRLDVKQPAETLGTTVDAVRKRIRRGTLEAERVDGKVYVWLDVEQDAVRTGDVDAVLEAKDETIAELRKQLDFSRRELEVRTEELRRKDSMIAALTSRAPELRLPAGVRETPENIAEHRGEREGGRPGAEKVLWSQHCALGGGGFWAGCCRVSHNCARLGISTFVDLELTLS